MYKYVRVEIVSHINTFLSFSSFSAINLEVFFMFPQAKNKQESTTIRMAILSLRTADYQSACRIIQMTHYVIHAH